MVIYWLCEPFLILNVIICVVSAYNSVPDFCNPTIKIIVDMPLQRLLERDIPVTHEGHTVDTHKLLAKNVLVANSHTCMISKHTSYS